MPATALNRAGVWLVAAWLAALFAGFFAQPWLIVALGALTLAWGGWGAVDVVRGMRSPACCSSGPGAGCHTPGR